MEVCDIIQKAVIKTIPKKKKCKKAKWLSEEAYLQPSFTEGRNKVVLHLLVKVTLELEDIFICVFQ